MPPDAVHVRRATDADRPVVLSLLAEYLPNHDVAKRHEWLYERNPHGKALTVVAFEASSGEPMGLTSLFPRRVRVEREVHLGSIGGDGFVRPKFRRRGVATALHRACLDSMNGASIEFMFGAPEPSNLGALLKAGSRAVTRLRRYSRPRGLHAMLRSMGHFGPHPRVELVPLDLHDARARDLVDLMSTSDEGRVAPIRDADHYAWRFGETPSRAQRAFLVTMGGKPAAMCALERSHGVVAVLDLVAPKGRHLQALRAIADAAGGEALSILANDASPEAHTLWQAGFFPREAKTFQVLAPWSQAFSRPLQEAHRWVYFWGDGDVDKIL